MVYIQDDQKSLCTWWLQYRKLQVMFKVSTVSLQTFIDMPNCVLKDRAQYSTVHIPNVFCDGPSSNHQLCRDCLNTLSCLYCNHQVHRDVLIPCTNAVGNLIWYTFNTFTLHWCLFPERIVYYSLFLRQLQEASKVWLKTCGWKISNCTLWETKRIIYRVFQEEQ
jgi:hypothetical protein